MPPQVANISAALAYQVKKEIAENYFGSRKVLEEERDDLTRQGKKLKEVWERTVLPNLIWICQYLIGEEEGKAFLDLIQRGDLLELVKQDLKNPGIDPSPVSSAVLFALTAKGKYKKLIFTLYQLAKTNGDELWNEFHTLQKKRSLFNEDLAKFTSCYNLSDILSLIHSIENRDDLKGVLGENTDPRAIPLLEEKLIPRPLDLAHEGAAVIWPLPPIKEIERPLKLLIDLAFHAHCSEIKNILRSY